MDKIKNLLKQNSMSARLIRTIFQGIIGVIIAYLDLIVGVIAIPPELRPVIVATVMAILSPIMSALSELNGDTKATE